MMEKKPYIITIVGPESSGKTTLARQLAAALGCPWVPEFAREYLEVRGGYYDESDLVMIAEGQLAIISKQLAVFGIQSTVSRHQSSESSHQAVLPPSPSKGVNALDEVFTRQSSIISTQLVKVSRETFVGGLYGNFEKKDVLTFYSEDFGDAPRPIVVIDSGMLGMRMWAKIKYNMTIPIVEEAMQDDVTSLYILCRPLMAWESDPLREAPLLLDRVWIYNHFLKELFLTQSM